MDNLKDYGYFVGFVIVGIVVAVAKYHGHILPLLSRWKKVKPEPAYQYPSYSVESGISLGMRINEVLTEARIKTNADRATVWQFHNGSSFLLSDPIWRATPTHWSCAAGLALPETDAATAASMVALLAPLFGLADSEYAEQLECTACSPCGGGRRVVSFNLEHMATDGWHRRLSNQGIQYLVCSPVVRGQQAIAVLAMEYRHVLTENPDPSVVCRAAARVNTEFERYSASLAKEQK